MGGTISLPLGLNHNQYLMEWLQGGNCPKPTALSPDIDIRVDAVSEMMIIRGIPSSLLVRYGMIIFLNSSDV